MIRKLNMSTDSELKGGCIKFLVVGALLMLIRYCADIGSAKSDTEGMLMTVFGWLWWGIKYIVVPIIVIGLLYGLYVYFTENNDENNDEDDHHHDVDDLFV